MSLTVVTAEGVHQVLTQLTKIHKWDNDDVGGTLPEPVTTMRDYLSTDELNTPGAAQEHVTATKKPTPRPMMWITLKKWQAKYCSNPTQADLQMKEMVE